MKFSHIVQQFGMKHSETVHSIFYCHNSPSESVYLVVYVDNIVITRNDAAKNSQLIQTLVRSFSDQRPWLLEGGSNSIQGRHVFFISC